MFQCEQKKPIFFCSQKREREMDGQVGSNYMSILDFLSNTRISKNKIEPNRVKERDIRQCLA